MGVSAPLVINEEGSCLSSSSNVQNDYNWWNSLIQAQNTLGIGAGAYYWLSSSGLGGSYDGEELLTSGYTPNTMGQEYINAYTAPTLTTTTPSTPAPTATPTPTPAPTVTPTQQRHQLRHQFQPQHQVPLRSNTRADGNPRYNRNSISNSSPGNNWHSNPNRYFDTHGHPSAYRYLNASDINANSRSNLGNNSTSPTLNTYVAIDHHDSSAKSNLNISISTPETTSNIQVNTHAPANPSSSPQQPPQKRRVHIQLVKIRQRNLLSKTLKNPFSFGKNSNAQLMAVSQILCRVVFETVALKIL